MVETATATEQKQPTKKLINDPSKVVDDSLRGLILSNPGLKLLPKHRVVYRSDVDVIKQTQVTLISGGGSGHEPAHVGFVGDGCLSAVVCGDVFASPSASQVLAAIRRVGGPAGVLVIVKNYTGDRLQFGKAIQRAIKEGIQCEMVVVGEDCAIEKSQTGGAGRRGLAGTLFVHKVAGAAARAGLPLKEVARRAQLVSDNIGTVGVALSSCSIPGLAPSFTLSPTEIELGLGIHGEHGAQRRSLGTSRELTTICLEYILDSSDVRGYLKVQDGDKLVLLVNNLGGATGLELGVVVADAVDYLKAKATSPVRVFSGSLMTALEMAGVSLTVLRIPKDDTTILDAIDEPVSALAWPRPVSDPGTGVGVTDDVVDDEHAQADATDFPISTPEGILFATTVQSAAKALIAAEPKITEYDQITGDGDCGFTLASGAQRLLSSLILNDEGVPVAAKGIHFDKPDEACAAISRFLEATMGGTSGALYCLFFDATANSLATNSKWLLAFVAGVEAVQHYGRARVGDRTMMDALLPAASSLKESEKISLAADAAKQGAEATASFDKANLGRTSYLVGGGIVGTPDPGAIGVSVIFEAVAKVLSA